MSHEIFPPAEPVLCSPQRLVELMRAGDMQALDDVTRCFGERLIRVGRSQCRDSQDAEDAVQDALLAAGENLQSFRGDGSLEGWLVRMVVNACHRMRRGQKNNPNLHDTEIDLVGTESPADASAQSQMMGKLGDAMLSLSPQDRVLVLLSEAEEWTGPEIAEELKMTPSAVRSRLTRARKKLRDSMGIDSLE